MHSEPAIAAQKRGLGVKTDSPVTMSAWWLSNRFKKKKKEQQQRWSSRPCIYLLCFPNLPAVQARPPPSVNKGISTTVSSQSHGQDNRGHGMASQQHLTNQPGSLQPRKETMEGTMKMGREVVYRTLSPMGTWVGRDCSFGILQKRRSWGIHWNRLREGSNRTGIYPERTWSPESGYMEKHVPNHWSVRETLSSSKACWNQSSSSICFWGETIKNMPSSHIREMNPKLKLLEQGVQ